MPTLMPRRLAILSVFLCALASASAMPGCIIVVKGDGHSGRLERETRFVEVAHQAGAPLHVDTRNGRVNIRRGEGDSVRIEAHVGARTIERLTEMEVVAERRENGELAVYPHWPGGRWRSNEACSFDIIIPDASNIVVRTSNGQIAVTGVGDAVNATTSNGAVTIEGPTGPVEARTSNGRVTVALDPSNPGPVALRSSNGSVTLHVGDAFMGRIAMSTSNGRVQVNDTPPARINSIGRSSATLTFGDAGGAASTVTTSNGGVTLSYISRGKDS